MTYKNPESKEEFSKWFTETNSSPWDYQSPFVLDRLEKSLSFIQSHLPGDFDGVFVEVGAFDGSFTRRLAAAFPRSTIVASDIVDDAWNKAASLHGLPQSITFICSDMESLRLPAMDNRPTVLLMLECLYYLSGERRAPAIENLVRQMGSLERAFVSGPLDGGKRYFSEQELSDLFKTNGMNISAVNVLNTTDTFRDQFSWNGSWRIKILIAMKGFIEARGQGGPQAASIAKLNAFEQKILMRLNNFLMASIARLNRLEQKAHQRLNTDQRYREKFAHQVLFSFAGEKTSTGPA